MIFESFHCIIKDSQNDKIIFMGHRNENVYTIDISKYEGHNRCFSSMHDESWLWHRRLGHVNMNLITQLNKNELVRGLPKISFEKNKVCEACKMGKQIKTSFKNKNFISTSRPLEFLHMDLFGSSRTTSLGGKSYAFVIVDDFSRYTWVLFLAHKNSVFHEFSKLCRKIQNEKGFTISCIRSDHGREFENVELESFCDEQGIEHTFSAPITPQQNEVVERKNRTLQQMAITILHENNLLNYFWAEAVNTSCYILNRVLIRSSLDKTPYELGKNKKPNISYFKVFGIKCFILNTKDNLGKFDSKSNVGIFLSYSSSSKAYRVFNKNIMVLEESVHVVFDESNEFFERRENVNDDVGLNTPMGSSIKLDMDEKGKSVDQTKYRGMFGSLLYLTASRPDIMYSVCLCARFQACPKESHLNAVKRIFRYLKGTIDIGLWYPKCDNFELICYSDADFGGCKIDRKSTSRTCHFLGHSLVSWHSKK